MKKSNPTIKAQILRSAFYVLLLLGICAIPFALAKRSFDGRTTSATSSTQTPRTLSFADRVAYQRAIEEVYWQHRIWPRNGGANTGPKPPLEKMMSQAQIEQKVEEYLRNSELLEQYWHRPITPEQLQAEMERMASQTKQPGVLREIFAALGNDPFVIAECLARPVLAERVITELYAHDQRFHGELKRRAEADLRTHPSVREMKQTSGMYTEMEWIKSDSTPDQDKGGSASPEDDAKANGKRRGAEDGITLNSREWDETVQKLVATFNKPDAATPKAFGVGVRSRKRGIAPFESADMSAHSKNAAADEYEALAVGKVSPLQEDEGHYYAVAVTNKGKDRLKLATVAWLKEPLRSWLAKAETQVPVTMAAVSANYTLPVIASLSGGCTDDTWTPTSLTSAPDARVEHTAVWTGTEMIIWGGSPFTNTGGRYNPSTDNWTATSTTNAPAARSLHTALWTGSEMIVWGGQFGFNFLNTGGRYNPGTNSWIATSTTNAPDGRAFHTAVWTGSEMIIWGGGNPFNTGGRYNPSTDSWTPTTVTNAPDARSRHTAVWTGSEMIVWGGGNGSVPFNSGGRYNPNTDSWTATSTTNAPDARSGHTAVWTGSQMIVWGGGNFLNTGGRYCAQPPSSCTDDTWTPTSLAGAPAARWLHTAVWSGSEMIVWGGRGNGGYLNTGGRYNPSTDSWAATSVTDAPAARQNHTAVWTGSEMTCGAE